jgi:hypothetical protein
MLPFDVSNRHDLKLFAPLRSASWKLGLSHRGHAMLWG